MRQRLRQPGQGLGLALAVGLAIVIVASVLVAATLHDAVPWERLDFGNVPAWLAFFASLGTLIGIWVAFASFRATRADRRRDEDIRLQNELAPARLLVVDHVAISHGSGYPTVLATLRNVGTDTFTDVIVTGVTLCDIACQQTHEDLWHERTHESHQVVKPGATLKSGWVLPDKEFKGRATERPEIQFEYTDGTGKRWRRLSTLDPERRLPRFDVSRRQRFDKAQAAIPRGDIRASVAINFSVVRVVPLPDHDDEAISNP